MRISYLIFLKRIVAIVYYAALCVLILGTLAIAYTYFRPIEHLKFYISVPIRLGDEIVYGDKGFVFTTHNAYSSWLSFDCFNRELFSERIGLFWKVTLGLFAGGLMILLMLRQVKLIIDSVGTVHVFSQANVGRIRILGGLLVLHSFDQLLQWLLIKNDVLALLQKHHAVYTLGGYGAPSLLSSSLFIGILLFGLAEVFRSGLYLKQEQELTV